MNRPQLIAEIQGRANRILAERAKWAGQVERLRESYHEFVKASWHIVEPARPFIDAWHIGAISEHLEAVSRGQIKNLLINVPPGHAKSLLVCVQWPAWQWIQPPTRWAGPQWRALFGSYAQDLAIRDSIRCRMLIQSGWYRETFQPTWTLLTDQNEKSYYVNTASGLRQALGVSGAGTGFKANCRVADDPLNAKDSRSELGLAECIRWWDHRMSSRLIDQTEDASVIIMQRLAQGDLSGHLIQRGDYAHLCLPTEYEPSRSCVTVTGFRDRRTESGELLFPELFGPAAVSKIKRELGAQEYAGQHQQRPSPALGGIFKRHCWRYWQRPGDQLPPVLVEGPAGEIIEHKPIELPELAMRVGSWDMAFKDSKTSAFVVGQVWGLYGARKFLIDQVRGKLDFVASCAAVEYQRNRHPLMNTVLVEDKANGPAILSQLKNKVPGLIAIGVQGSKEARAAAESPSVEAGDVYLPHPHLASWVSEYIEELATFPNSVYKDQTDATSQALYYLRTSGPVFYCEVV
jgi:predicted phage terminase large subunit-like protein